MNNNIIDREIGDFSVQPLNLDPDDDYEDEDSGSGSDNNIDNLLDGDGYPIHKD